MIQVKVAVPLGEHVLLRGGGRAPHRVAGEALAVLEDYEVKIADQGLEVDDEALGGGDEEPMGLVHVREVGGEGGGGGGAEEALLRDEGGGSVVGERGGAVVGAVAVVVGSRWGSC